LPFLWSKKPIKNRGRAYYFPPPPPPPGGGGGGGLNINPDPYFFFAFCTKKWQKITPRFLIRFYKRGGGPRGGPPSPKKSRFWLES
jgi:hypothetical protein